MKVKLAIIKVFLKSRFLFRMTFGIIKLFKKMEENIRKKQANEMIVSIQGELISLVSKMHMEGKICFSSVSCTGDPDGNYWKPEEKIKGDYIFKKLKIDPDWVVEISKRVVDDYQKVIKEYHRKNPVKAGDLMKNGRIWMFGNLLKWGGSIVEEGLMNYREIVELADILDELAKNKGEDFFGYSHGNVIGNHIYVGYDKTLYLLGMRIVPRLGGGYYDFLRSLDWIILNSDSRQFDFDRICGWMKRYLAEYDWREVGVVFAFRCIGVLGWDILHRGDPGQGDLEIKKQLLMKFIRRNH